MKIIHILLALLAGLGLGLAYSWGLAPVTYVDANPAMLRSDFKDQYRLVIAVSYASTHDLTRARARLELLGNTDSIVELNAQAQRMVGASESFEQVQPLTLLAADLQQGVASIPSTSLPFLSTPFVSIPTSKVINTPAAVTPTEEIITAETQSTSDAITPTTSFAQTALAPVASSTFAPRPTFTAIPAPGAPFALVSQDAVCEPGKQNGLMQFILIDKRSKQIAGIEIIVTSNLEEDHSFSGFKPELGNGYADFVMQADTIYSVRVVEGGTSISNISAPTCTDPKGTSYIGGWLLTFQQP